ncbi:hypothetical protein BJ546DRAFT_721991 [Cryomyces antarcticus]|uniref:Protein kinase domain-containing protein n=1 Tax=Cryomyces antarcticus TaxID=329879 RepID=A0ABR0KVY0_9PEZI|nr:hypothetical protein LTR16_000499 [Cryomyces antarcticus]
MPPAVRSPADLLSQRNKLANSYSDLLDEFSSKDLRTVGNYTLGRLVGKGSFGKVYLASHKLINGSKVVLKSAKKDDANLAREIHHHRQFLHPHIARLYEVIVTESLVWLVLEYCPGDELYNHLLENGRMEAAKVQKIFTQLIGAVSYVHNMSCVHRDLKLENILLDKHGNVKLVDFGFTREYEGKASYLQTWCGTVCYSAPEMLKGEKYAGEKVDVWSLGVILYALLCGELPFDEDDETETKARILKDEPKYPDHMSSGAKELVQQLLSKRPILRPSLSDILKDPWLSDHAPQQQEILKLLQPAPFTTQLEKDTLQRMHSAGVDIDQVIENVLAQRCDGLAGWWALLIEKEERKEKRRQAKRNRRESEAKSLRRLSAGSSRLLAPSLKEIDEEGQHTLLLGNPPRSRGRNLSRSSGACKHSTMTGHLLDPGTECHTAPASDLARLSEASTFTPETSEAPPPIGKDALRSASSSRDRPPPPPNELRRPRNNSRNSASMLQVVSTNPDLLTPNGFIPKRRRRYQQPLMNQLASIKAWFKESAKRAKSPNSSKPSMPSSDLSPKSAHRPGSPGEELRRSSTGPPTDRRRPSVHHARPELHTRATFPQRPRISTTASTGSGSSNRQRPSLSPSPLTPHSSYRRPSGLRGRKSTSSSVSSVRSIHQHRPSHSKTSSTSSNSIASPSASYISSTSKTARSPHASTVKVLPATPTASAFPSGVRIARVPPAALGSLPNRGETASRTPFHGAGPPSPGLPLFAKRKRSPFKGPALLGAQPTSHRRGSRGGSRSGSVDGRRSGELAIQEEDEEEEDEFEEVDAFGPVAVAEGEYVVEETFAPGEEVGALEGLGVSGGGVRGGRATR